MHHRQSSYFKLSKIKKYIASERFPFHIELIISLFKSTDVPVYVFRHLQISHNEKRSQKYLQIIFRNLELADNLKDVIAVNGSVDKLKLIHRFLSANEMPKKPLYRPDNSTSSQCIRYRRRGIRP